MVEIEPPIRQNVRKEMVDLVAHERISQLENKVDELIDIIKTLSNTVREITSLQDTTQITYSAILSNILVRLDKVETK